MLKVPQSNPGIRSAQRVSFRARYTSLAAPARL